MSDRGSSSEPARNPKFIDLTGFAGIKKKVELQVRQPELRRPAGRRAYRSLDELQDTPEFRQLMHQEFPQAAGEWDDGTSRRNFLKLMGASIALAGLTTACAPKPEERIVPYVQQPEGVIPGKPLFYASAMPWMGYGKGILVEQHEGRPTKIEGNPDHPSSLGAADVWAQASILGLYDPDRSQVLTRFGNVATWGSFLQSLGDALAFTDWAGPKQVRRTAKPRVRILTETVTSPTIRSQVAALQKALPDLVWHTYDAVGRDNILAGAKLAFGNAQTPAAFVATTAPATAPAGTQPATAAAAATGPSTAGAVEPIYHFDRAEFVVSLDCNFLTDEPGSQRYAREYISRRKVRVAGEHKPTSRLFVVESAPTVAGAMADALLRVKPDDVHAFAKALYEAVKEGGKHHGATFPGCEWFGKMVEDLAHHKGESLVCAGEYAPPAVHVLCHAINAALGNIGQGKDDKKPISLIPVVSANPGDSVASLTALRDAIKAGAVDVLLILGANVAYSAPADLDLEAVLNTAITGSPTGDVPAGKTPPATRPFVAHLGLYEDETARVAEWHLPEAHFLEAWGDVRGHDGTPSIIQPLIAPLYPGCKSAVEVLAGLIEKVGVGTTATSAALANSMAGYEAVRAVWRQWHGQYAAASGDFETWWTLTLERGVAVPNPKDRKPPTEAGPVVGYEPVNAPFQAGTVEAASNVAQSAGLVVMFRPDPNVWDGSFANNAWLQETPKPLTKLTWDNALLVSPKVAVAMGLTGASTANVFKQKFTEALGKTIDLTVNGKTLKDVPVWVVPGHADGCATLHLGYGRRHAGRVASPVEGHVGHDAYSVRTTATRWAAANATYSAPTGTVKLACTQNQQVINNELNHGRELVLHGDSLGEVANEFAHHMAVKYGLGEGGHAHGDEYKRTPADNLALARRVGLPILPDDPGTSPMSLYPDQPDQLPHGGGHDPLYPAWGMVIDQNACIGCNACVVACQAENNVPVVGKEQVIVGRQMQWLRIDTYHLGANLDEANDPHGHSDVVNIEKPEATFFQPLMCVHCEKAPCEQVCPVGATVHDKEGLNVMVYNRCVGTRYCSNNCPYKVRRFNFLKFNDDTTPVLKLLRNPEVSVRSRGVMEKCTYCIQRISRGRIEAKKVEVKMLSAGATPQQAQAKYMQELDKVVTACQQSCPTEAIVFGNMADPNSKVSKLKQEPVGFQYGLLQELNTRPRTSYLARIDNPVPGSKKEHDHAHDKPGEAGKTEAHK